MGILVLINITACLALIDIALKSTIEGYMTQKEERKLSKITLNMGDVLIGIGGIFVVIAAVIAQLRGKKK